MAFRMLNLLAQDIALPTSGLVTGGIAASVVAAALAFAKIVATHFKDRETQQYNASLAREAAMTEKIERIDGVQRAALMELALSFASQTSTLTKIIEVNTKTHQQLIDAFRDWTRERKTD